MANTAFFRLATEDLGIYLGTPTSWVCSQARGLVVVEPTLVAVNKATNRIEAVGDAARLRAVKDYAVEAVAPAKDNVVEDSEAAESLLRHLYRQAIGRKFWVRPRVLFPVPGYSTAVERKALRNAALGAGASEVFLVSTALIAALGAGVPITHSKGTMILHIGRSGTEIAIFSDARVVARHSMPIGTSNMDMAIVESLKRKYYIQIALATAERIRSEIGTAYPLDKDIDFQINCKDLIENIPKTLTVSSNEIGNALAEPLSTIIEGVRLILERAPAELAGDLVDTGIGLSGDGALLRGLDRRLQKEVDLPVAVAQDALATLALGIVEYLSSWDLDAAEPLSWKQREYGRQTSVQESNTRGLPGPNVLYSTPNQSSFHSCFLSYSHADGNFAEQLYGDLQKAGVICFFAPKNLPIGALTRPALDENVRRHDKLLLILSEHSVRSQWVEQEVESALAKERSQNQTVLFPVRIDGTVLEYQGGWPELIRNTRHIGDFTEWRQPRLYRLSLERLLNDLRPSQ